MKIDKIVFACSESSIDSSGNAIAEYSSFWNIQARLWKEGFGIEPICLLFGKKSNTDMSEQHGKIIEMETLSGIPSLIQLTWSKFNFPTTEPDTTWIIGDIDMFPLQHNHFVKAIADIHDDHFAHLNASGNVYDDHQNKFFEHGSQIHGKFRGSGYSGCDLPGHYWVGKGKRFEIFTEGKSFEQQVRYIAESHRYGLGPIGSTSYNSSKPDSYYWCAEEMRSSELMYDAIRSGKVNYSPIFYSNQEERIDRSAWNEAAKDYGYSAQRLIEKKIVDIHCARPYTRQKEACERIISLSGILSK